MGATIPLDALVKAGGTPLDVTGGAAGAGGVLSGIGAAASMSNPITAGLQIMSMLSGSSVNKSGGGASAASGFAFFEGENNQDYARPLFDLSSIRGVLLASGLVVLTIYAYSKYKG